MRVRILTHAQGSLRHLDKSSIVYVCVCVCVCTNMRSRQIVKLNTLCPVHSRTHTHVANPNRLHNTIQHIHAQIHTLTRPRSRVVFPQHTNNPPIAFSRSTSASEQPICIAQPATNENINPGMLAPPPRPSIAKASTPAPSKSKWDFLLPANMRR